MFCRVKSTGGRRQDGVTVTSNPCFQPHLSFSTLNCDLIQLWQLMSSHWDLPTNTWVPPQMMLRETQGVGRAEATAAGWVCQVIPDQVLFGCSKLFVFCALSWVLVYDMKQLFWETVWVRLHLREIIRLGFQLLQPDTAWCAASHQPDDHSQHSLCTFAKPYLGTSPSESLCATVVFLLAATLHHITPPSAVESRKKSIVLYQATIPYVNA